MPSLVYPAAVHRMFFKDYGNEQKERQALTYRMIRMPRALSFAFAFYLVNLPRTFYCYSFRLSGLLTTGVAAAVVLGLGVGGLLLCFWVGCRRVLCALERSPLFSDSWWVVLVMVEQQAHRETDKWCITQPGC